MIKISSYLSTLSMFGDLNSGELDDVSSMVRPIHHLRGRELFRQGDESDGMYMIQSGRVEVCARIPGDEEVVLRSLGPGEVLGELSLLDGGLRTATARVTETLNGFWLGRRHFDLLRFDEKSASLAIMRKLIASTCASVRRAIQSIAGQLNDVVCNRGDLDDLLLEDASLDGIFAESLPYFRDLSADERAHVMGEGRLRKAARGAVLCRQGDEAGSVFVLLRGAARSLRVERGAFFQLAIHAPGAFLGILPALDGANHSLRCEACEESVVLEFPNEAFLTLMSSSWLFNDRLHEELVRLMRRCTDHLARLELERHLRTRRS